MRKILLAVGAAVALVLVALLVVPALIDWGRYRGEITARLEEALGRDVRIDGDVGLRLLPSPAFTAERVVVGTIEGVGSQPFATAESLDIRLQWLPLLRGDVAVDHLVLERPVVNLVRLPDGRVNWDFPTAGEEAASPEAAPPKPGPMDPTPTRSDGGELSLDMVRITQGVVTYRSGESEPIRAEAIDATLRMGSLSGPFAASGSAVVEGTRLTFDGALDRMAEGRGSPVRLAVTVPDAAASVSLSGMLSTLKAGPTLRARLVADIPRPAILARLFAVEPPALPPGPARIEGALTASAEQVALSEIEARLGEARAAGQVGIGFGEVLKIDANLAVAALDLDAWTAPQAAPAPRRGEQSRPAPGPGPAPAPASAPPADFSLPAGLFVNAALGIEALSWQGAVVEDVRVEATLDQSELVLRTLSARLPGNSALTVAGTLAAERGSPVFDGQAALTSDNARALLAWAGVDVASVPADRLRRLEARSAIRAAWPEIAARDLTGAVDATRLRGRATVRLTERPFYGLDLAVDSLNLDAYRPAETAATEPPAPAPKAQPVIPAQPAPAPPPAQAPTDALAGFDADIRLAVDRLVVNTVPAETVRLNAALTGGVLEIRQAAADLAGSRASLQGRVLGLDRDSPRVENLTFAVDSPRPERLFRFLGIDPPVEPARLGQLAAQGRLDGDVQSIAVDATLRTGGMEARAKGSLANPLTVPRYEVAVQASHPSFTQFMRLFSPDYRPAGNPGAVQANANVAGGADQIRISDLGIAAGPARITGAATIGLAGPRPSITADLTGNAIVLDPFLPAEKKTGQVLPVPGGLRLAPGALPSPSPSVVPVQVQTAGPWSREALDLSALSAADARISYTGQSLTWGSWLLEQPQARLAVEGGAARLEQFSGRLLGGTLDATALLSSAGTPALTGTLAIDGANLAQAKLGAGGIAVTQGRLSASAQFRTQGRSTHAMAGALAGQGKIQAADGVIGGFDLPAVNRQLQNIQNVGNLLALVQTGLSGGQTRFSQLAGTFTAENGVVVTRDTTLTAEGGSARLNSDIRLQPWTMTTIVSVQLADTTAPPVHLRLEGPIDNPRRIVDINALQQHLAARGLGRALKGTEPGRIIEDLLGGGRRAPQQQQQPQQPPDQQRPEKPEEVIRDLLKGLIR